MRLSENAVKVLEYRYLRKEGNKVVETPEELFRRVARNVASVEGDIYKKPNREVAEIEEVFFEMMTKLDFLPNSPALMNAGTELQQLAACFVIPIEDSMESIFDAVKAAALIHKSGGGTGYSFSRLRPEGDQVLSTGGVASGPVSFLKVFNAATNAVKQGGRRRGANIGILRVDHPDIMKFVQCKQDDGVITNFNISVGITDSFIKAVLDDRPFDLINPRTKEVVKTLEARKIFNAIVESAWGNGEPGLIFLDTINRVNPTPNLGEIEASNPCGEVPLLPYEACVLGSINLNNMVTGDEPDIDWAYFQRIIRYAVRFLDDTIDASKFPLEEIAKKIRLTRKIGLGVMGFADMLIRLGIPYNSDEAISMARKVMQYVLLTARDESTKLAREKGPFPAFEGSVYARKGRSPLRNATVTTIAPTGSISIIADCSSGIEPLFAVCYTRNALDNKKLSVVHPLFMEIARRRGFYSEELMGKISECGTVQGMMEVPEDVQRLFVTAHDIDPEWHVKIQAAFQEFTDNAVSKTINLRHDATIEDVRNSFLLAYELGCKGITVYRDRSRESQVLEVQNKEGSVPQDAHESVHEPAHEDVQVAIQKAVSAPFASTCETLDKKFPRSRPRVTYGMTERIETGCGNVYVTVNEDEKGLCEVFTLIGKSGGCASAQLEAIGRLVSLALRTGVEPEWIIKHLRGIRCPSPSWQRDRVVLSCSDAIGIALENYLKARGANSEKPLTSAIAGSVEKISTEEVGNTHRGNGLSALDNHIGACPECGGFMKHDGGCATCILCGYSRCS